MATETAERTFSEAEMVAIVADRVARETAELTEARETLSKDKDELASKLDVEIAAREAADQKATKAETDLEEFKKEIEARQAAAEKKDERIAKVREAASHLKDEYFEDEERIKRLVSMDDESFEGHLSDLRAVSANAPKDSAPPRETALEGESVTPDANKAPAAEGFLMRSYLTPVKEA